MSESVLKTDNNLYVITGERLTPIENTVCIYDFDYIAFKDCDFQTFEHGKTTMSYEELKKELELKNNVLYALTLGDVSPEDWKAISNSRWSNYSSLSSCIISGSGSVVPRPYIPALTDFVPLLDNGVYTKSSNKHLSLSNVGLNWYSTQKEIINAGTRKDSNEYKAGYIDMSSAITDTERGTLGTDGRRAITREYYPYFGEHDIGAFMLLCTFNEQFPPSDDKDSPKITLQINGVFSPVDKLDQQKMWYMSNVFSEISLVPFEGVIAEISGYETNRVHGSLLKGECKMNAPQSCGIDVFDNAFMLYVYPVHNGLVITGDVLDGVQSGKTVFVPIKKNATFLSDIDPSISHFPSVFQKYRGLEDAIITKVEVPELEDNLFDFDGTMKLKWVNATGNFAYCPLQFASRFGMRYYFVDQYSLMEDTTIEYYAIPLYYKNGSDYYLNAVNTVNPQPIKAHLIGYTKTDDAAFANAFYCFDFLCHSQPSFDIPKDNNYIDDNGKDGEGDGDGDGDGDEEEMYSAKLRPLELYGFIFVKCMEGDFNNLTSEDGVFSSDINITSDLLYNLYKPYENGRFSVEQGGGEASSEGEGSNSNEDGEVREDWMEYITDISIQHDGGKTDGSLTLDKYAMMNNLYEFPTQSIGALTLRAINGPHGNLPFSHPVYGNVEMGQIFKGYAYEIANNISNSPHMTVTLCGIAKKLDDMKLIHAPFWDGNQVFGDSELGNKVDVLTFFRNYTGCRIYCSKLFTETALSEIRLPMSHTYTNPSVYFKNGTSCYSALEEIAEKINHQFLIQPNGCGYFYEMDSYGLPKWLYSDANVPVMNYSKNDIISYSIKPEYENRFNYIMTMGMVDKPSSEKNPNDVDFELQMRINNLGEENGGFPWSRIVVNATPGVLNRQSFGKLHNDFVNQFKTQFYSGSISVPGYPYFFILDIITIEGVKYYINSISHTISIIDKSWTTNLSIIPLPTLSQGATL